MIYELRTYSAMPGRLPELSRRFADATIGHFEEHGIEIRTSHSRPLQILHPFFQAPVKS